jgi:hypothetical protein
VPDFKGPRRLALAEAPKNGLTQGQVAAPFSYMAKALDAVGDAAGELAKPFAEEAAKTGVTVQKDEAGNDVVVPAGPLPIFGDAGKSYSRVAQLTYLTKAQPELETALHRAALEFPNDPDSYKRASEEIVRLHAQRAGTPALRVAIEGHGKKELEQGFRGILSRTDAKALENASIAFKSRLEELSNKGAALARQGGTQTDEYLHLQEEVRSIYGELEKDPRFKFPAERVQKEMSHMLDLHTAEAIIGEGMRIYDRKTATSKEDARKYFNETIFDPSLNLKMAERYQLQARGLAALEAKTAEGGIAVKANRQLVKEVEESIKKGTVGFNMSNIQDLKAKSAAMGDEESYIKLATLEAFGPGWGTLASMPLSEMNKTISLFRSAGGSGSFESKLYGQESTSRDFPQGGDPRLVNQLGYAGMGQFGAPRLETLGVYQPGAAENMKGWSKTSKSAPGKWSGTFNIPGFEDIKTLADFTGKGNVPMERVIEAQRKVFDIHRNRMDHEIDKWGLAKYEGQTVGGVRITREGLYAMLHLGGENTVAAMKTGFASNAADANGATLRRYAAAHSGAARPTQSDSETAMTTSLDARRQEYVNDIIAKQKENLPGAVKTAEIRLGQGQDLEPQSIEDLADAIWMTGQYQHIETLEKAFTSRDGLREIGKAPISQMQQFVFALKERARKGATDKENEIIQTLIKGAEDRMKGMEKTPYTTAASRGIIAPSAPLTFNDPIAFQTQVQQRSIQQKVISDYDTTGPVSVFEGDESKSFRGALLSAKPEAYRGLIEPLYRLDNGQLFATLNDKDVKEGLQGLIRTNDPAKLTAAMPLIDVLDRRDRDEFERIMGKDADRLRVWQSHLDYYGPEQIAEKLKRDQDPQVEKVRAELLTKGQNTAKEMTTADIVGKFDQSYIFGLIGDRPNRPDDANVRARLAGDYRNVFARYYSLNDGNEEEAHKLTVEKMQTKWTRTAAGGQIMQNAPDKYYPKFGGSHEWLAKDIEDSLAKHLGDRYSLVRVRGRNDPPNKLGNNWDYTIVPDAQTQAEFNAGLPPSYNVVVRKVNDSEWSAFQINGTPQRWRPDMATAQVRAEENMNNARAATWNRWGQRIQRPTLDAPIPE